MNKTVYSTNPDWQSTCETCGLPVSDCNCAPETIPPPSEQTVYLERDSKGRKGKTVTVISNIRGDLKQIQQSLQRVCGAGGSVKDGRIEIQGDQRVKVREYLEKAGYRVKQKGG